MWKYILAWLPLLIIAVANGALREGFYAKYLDKLLAHQVSTLSGILFFGIYIWWLMRSQRPRSPGQAIAVGLVWLNMTTAFEFLFMHYVAGHSWDVLLHDYNIFAGRLWVLMLIWITLAPYLFYSFGSGHRKAKTSSGNPQS